MRRSNSEFIAPCWARLVGCLLLIACAPGAITLQTFVGDLPSAAWGVVLVVALAALSALCKSPVSQDFSGLIVRRASSPETRIGAPSGPTFSPGDLSSAK